MIAIPLMKPPITKPMKKSPVKTPQPLAWTSMTSKPKQRRGVVAVEFAIVLPVILLVFFGVIFITQSILLRDTAQHAAYEGARRGLVLDASAADCIAKTQEFLEKIDIHGATVTVSPEELAPSSPKVSVTVSIPMSQNAWVNVFPVQRDFVRNITLTREFTR